MVQGILRIWRPASGAKLVSLLVPLLAPVGLGFWQIVVALVAGISAKEVMVSSFIVLFGIQGRRPPEKWLSALNGKLSFISFGPLNAFCMMLHRNLTFFILKQNISSNCVTIAVNRRGGFPMDELTKPHYQIYYNQKPLSPQVSPICMSSTSMGTAKIPEVWMYLPYFRESN